MTAVRPDGADRGFGIYVHWPFCLSKCPYCDFNSHVRERIDQPRWRAALLAELAHWAALVPGRTVTSLFFGGGTPSLMPPETVAAVIEAVRRHWPVAEDIEITLEANPGAAEADRFAALRAAGIGRLSLGVQALDDAALAFLGRRHDRAEALAALDRARTAFGRVSFDLIYALPGQTAAAWARDLDEALSLEPSHLSVYQLVIEPGTAFEGAVRRGEFVPAGEDTAAALYEATLARLAAAGLPAYEISNHARPGEESRHNLLYWRYGDHVGIGPGAHGRTPLPGPDGRRVKHATRQHRAPEAWLDQVERDGHATRERRALEAGERGDEMLMMGMRLVEGVDGAAFRAETGRDLLDHVDRTALGHLRDGGFVEVDGDRLRATAEGRQRLDAVLAALLPG